MSTTITLSLISHTNVGKTTLARTLLRRDVGEVLDQAHVTEASEAYTLIATEEATLRLWDTPGFGDTRRLLHRLRRQRDPLGWFLHQVWDRIADRPLFCGQRAVRNMREEADVVLYVVNASEDPSDAGYVPLELEILDWVGRPVLLLLNQLSRPDRGVESSWRTLAAQHPLVRDVLCMDAFCRCWTEEGVLLQAIVDLFDGPRRDAMADLATAWAARDVAVFSTSCEAMARYLARAAADREVPAHSPASSSGWLGVLGELTGALKLPLDKRRAMAALARRLDRATHALMQNLIAAHGLVGSSAATLERRIEDVELRGSPPFSARTGAVAGAVMSGAIGGLVADILSGGLSLGGGMIAGGLLGALGGSALGGAYAIIKGPQEPAVQWTGVFLARLVRQTLLRYLAVAHFGRGRGPYQELENPARWSEAVEGELKHREDALRVMWEADTGDRQRELASLVEETLRAVLRHAYPRARRILAD